VSIALSLKGDTYFSSMLYLEFSVVIFLAQTFVGHAFFGGRPPQ